MSKEKVMKGRWGEKIKITIYDEGVVINNNGMWIYLYWEDWKKVRDFIEDMNLSMGGKKLEDIGQITRLKELLSILKEERARHLRESKYFSGTKAETYCLGSADALEAVIKQLENILDKSESCEMKIVKCQK